MPWQSLQDSEGEGVGSSLVLAMASYSGSLYVGGDFTSAGGVAVNRIARLDGSQWHDVAGGMTGVDIGGTTATVTALHVHEQALVAGGRLLNAGGVEVNHAASWNGSQWVAVGNGFNSSVLDLTTFNGQLHTGGAMTASGAVSLSRVSRLNPTLGWQPVGNGPSATVSALAVYGGELVAGGNFTHAGGIEVRRIARWNGQNWLRLERAG